MIIVIESMAMIQSEVIGDDFSSFSFDLYVCFIHGFIDVESFDDGTVLNAVMLGRDYHFSTWVEIDLVLFANVEWIGFGVVFHVPQNQEVFFDGVVNNDDDFLGVTTTIDSLDFRVVLFFTDFYLNGFKVLFIEFFSQIVVMNGILVVIN